MLKFQLVLRIIFGGVACLCVLPEAAKAQEFEPEITSKDIQSIINFLSGDKADFGITYQGTAGRLNGLRLPLSYLDSPQYWGEYVCQLYENHDDLERLSEQLESSPETPKKIPIEKLDSEVSKVTKNDCTVKDAYSEEDYTLMPLLDSPGADLQIERVNVHVGSNIYDASTWQIAIALAARAGLKGASGESIEALARNQSILLSEGYTGQTRLHSMRGKYRAITQPNDVFQYSGIGSRNQDKVGIDIHDPEKAFFFRMIPQSWMSDDPFKGTDYEGYISTLRLPNNNSIYQKGRITWADWRPIAGENAWAFLIGPLQSAYIRDVLSGEKQYVPFESLEVQTAIPVLHAFKAMQSKIGAIYYAPKGTLPNTGVEPVDRYQVSVENNASVLAGLKIFRDILNLQLEHEKSLSQSDKMTIYSALKDLKTLIDGDKTTSSSKYTTEGLLNFFENHAWDAAEEEFLVGGFANDPKREKPWVPFNEEKKDVLKAVDTTTWVISVLGPEVVDTHFDHKSKHLSYDLWEDVKSWGGFYGGEPYSADKPMPIWGVGYSQKDDFQIFSAEWTAGAINTLRSLIVHYEKSGNTSIVEQLELDERSMFKHLMYLRTDKYPNAVAFTKYRPPNYTSLLPMPSDKLAFLYANKRYNIPFGWYANPLPSMASTTWAVMLYYNYNPFVLGGEY